MRAELLRAALFCLLLLVASVQDIRSRTIPDTVCVLLALTGLIAFEPYQITGVLLALPLVLVAIVSPQSLGGGDVKLVAACGFVLGFWGGITAFALTVLPLSAVLLAGILRNLCCREKKPWRVKWELPLAPFLSLGFGITAILQQGGLHRVSLLL